MQKQRLFFVIFPAFNAGILSIYIELFGVRNILTTISACNLSAHKVDPLFLYLYYSKKDSQLQQLFSFIFARFYAMYTR